MYYYHINVISLTFFFFMIRRPPISTRTDTLFPTRRSSDLGRSQWRRGFPAARRIPILHCCDSTLTKRNCGKLICRSQGRSEEHTSELQSLMRISYAVFCLKKKKNVINPYPNTHSLSPSHHYTKISERVQSINTHNTE